MGHRLETVGEWGAAFAYNADNGDPWHRLGNPMAGYQTAEDMLEAAYANYTVEIAPCYTLIPLDGWEPGAVGIEADVETGTTVWHKLVTVEGKNVTWRQRPIDGSYQALGVVGDRYTTAQNLAVVERGLAIVGASEGDAVMDTAGVLDDGRRFFALVNLGGLVIDPTGVNDRIARYMAISTGHDGSAAIQYTMTDIRVVCNNTLQAALKGARKFIRAKHTPNHVATLEEARQVLGFSVTWAEKFADMANTMLAIPFTEGQVANAVDKLFPVAADAGDRAKKNHDELQDKIRWIFRNEKNAGKVGDNAWAFYNAVGEYLDHHRSDDRDAMALTSMDDGSWVTKTKLAAQALVLS